MTLFATGLALHAEERNAQGAPPVLFLHGWLDHCHSFDPLWAELPGAWRLFALDFRGHGQSAHLTQGIYHFTDYLADVHAGVLHLGGRVHLVGHSMGGAVALLYAAAAPERVKSVTAIESLGPLGGRPEDIVKRMGQFVVELEKVGRKRLYPTLEDAVARVRANNPGLSPSAALLLTRHGTRAVPGGVEFTFDPVLRHRSAFTFDDAQLGALLGAVKQPVQVIQGTRGYPFDADQAADRLRRLGAPAPIAVEGGHHVHLDSPAQVATYLRQFVERVEG